MLNPIVVYHALLDSRRCEEDVHTSESLYFEVLERLVDAIDYSWCQNKGGRAIPVLVMFKYMIMGVKL